MFCLGTVVNGGREGTQGYLMSAEEALFFGKLDLSKSVDYEAPIRSGKSC